MLTEKQKEFLGRGIGQLGLPTKLAQQLIAGGMIGPCGILLWQRFSDIPVYEYLGLKPEDYSLVCEVFNRNEIDYKNIKQLDLEIVECAEKNWVRGLLENIVSGNTNMLFISYNLLVIEDYLEFRAAHEQEYREFRFTNPQDAAKLDLLLEQFGQSKERNSWRSVICTTE